MRHDVIGVFFFPICRLLQQQELLDLSNRLHRVGAFCLTLPCIALRDGDFADFGSFIQIGTRQDHVVFVLLWADQSNLGVYIGSRTVIYFDQGSCLSALMTAMSLLAILSVENDDRRSLSAHVAIVDLTTVIKLLMQWYAKLLRVVTLAPRPELVLLHLEGLFGYIDLWRVQILPKNCLHWLLEASQRLSRVPC